MIRKATERPKEVQYIEFKGKDNFDEVREFVGGRVGYLITSEGREQIIFNYNITNEENRRYGVGMIFYKTGEYGELEITTKENFFAQYKSE